ncbi:MAG: TonB-dependent receptor [Tannerellaceae bacterium]|nr:TonB-dependent receptor [Tannerellaceae bacterium]
MYAVEGASQIKKVSIVTESSSFRDVLSNIEKQTDYLFIYAKSEIDLDKRVTVNAQDKLVTDVLNVILRNTDIEYAVEGNNIMLMKKSKNHTSALRPIQQQQSGKNISGRVVDASNEPIIGANVVEKGTTNGSITDIDGNFSLNVREGAVLVVSYIGYTQRELSVGNQQRLTIQLTEDSQAIDEVVVVGYGTQKKVNLTGAVSTVKFDQEMENRPITDVSQALQGKVTGVWATQFSGNPGDDGATIRIRGYGSLGTASNSRDPNPLILIDGIEGKMSEVDPSAIESMTILKDAASAAIYGSRAANGVILIETKKGEADKVRLTYNGYVGIQQLGRSPDLISNSAEYMELWNEALTNTGGAQLFPDDVINAFKTGTDPYKYPNTDFSKAIFREAFTTQHTLSANVGSKNSTTFVSLSYMANNGIMYQTSAERYSLNLNNETKINNWLRIGARARMQRRVNLEPAGMGGTSGINRALYMVANGHPFAPPYLQDGKTFGASQAVYLSGERAGQAIVDTRNPFPDLYNGEQRTSNNFFRGNVFGTLTFMEGLALTANYSGQYTNNTRDRYNQPIYCYLDLEGNGMTKSLDYITTVTNERRVNDEWYSTFFANLNFNRTFADIHEVSGVVGYQQESLTKRYTEAKRINPPKDELHQVNAGTDNIEAYGNKYEWRMLSYFGRVNYALMGKYLFEVNVRADASSRFAKENRWGYFPSLSAGWRLGEESFIKDLGVFDNLKLRASWGQLGNQNTGSRNNTDYFPYLTIVTQDYSRSYNYGNSLAPGAAVIGLSEANLTWETTTTTDIGVDLGFLKNRLNIEADYFYKLTSDILVALPLPITMGGLTPPTENIGEVENKGFELNASWQDRLKSTGLSYRVGANFTLVNNMVTKFQGGKSPDQLWLIREGYSFNSLYGYICEGVYQSDEEGATHLYANSYKPVAGDLKYKDLNGDGKIDNGDMTGLGNTIPKYNFGLNGSVSYKNFDLSFAFSGSAGYTAYFNNAWSQPLGVSGGPIFTRWRDRWTPDNPSQTIPRITINNAWLRNYASSFWTADMFWMKLKNIQLGYLVPQAISKKLSLQKLYVYLNASEVFTLVNSDYEGYDPERDTMGNGYYHYPVPQVFSLGLNVTF